MKTLDATAAHSWCLVRIDALPFAVALGAVAEIVDAESKSGSHSVLPRCSGSAPIVASSCLSLPSDSGPSPRRVPWQDDWWC